MRLLDLADVCRSAGLAVREEPGWQQRSRRSNAQEYPAGGPTTVMVHHTASPPHTDGQPDVNYICYNSPVKPIANLYLSRSGEVWVTAAGPTNTNGSGHDWWGGGVPDNSMNTYAIGIEAANRGTGEVWPGVQQDAYVKLCAALCDRYAIPVGQVRSHFEWAPSRKNDPAGESRYARGAAKWDMNLFRSDVFHALNQPLPPGPGEDMPVIAYVAQPPADMPGNSPWMIVIDGAVRYMTNEDGPANLPAKRLNREQYEYLLKCANLA